MTSSKKYKYCLLLFAWLVIINSLNAQNFLANGGFEDVNICTEFKIECAPAAWVSTSTSFSYYYKDARMAKTGTRCMGLIAGNINKPFKRTFLRSRLLCKLQKGKQYQVNFFVKSRHDLLDNVAVLFTDYDFLFEKKEPYKITPSVSVNEASIKPIKTDTNWQQITLHYTATGDEIFITFGYFSRNDLKGNTGIPKENNFIFYIDDISLIPVDKDEGLCFDWQTNRDNLYAQHERHQYLDKLARYLQNSPPPQEQTPVVPVMVHHLVDTLVIPDILFANASAELNKNSFNVLDSFCQVVIKKQYDSLIVEGHTDSTGMLSYNTKLSSDRANSVFSYINNKINLPPQKVIIRSFAYLKPIASNQTAEGRQKNRRVVIYLYRH